MDNNVKFTIVKPETMKSHIYVRLMRKLVKILNIMQKFNMKLNSVWPFVMQTGIRWTNYYGILITDSINTNTDCHNYLWF